MHSPNVSEEAQGAPSAGSARSAHVFDYREHAVTALTIPRISDSWLRAPSEQALAIGTGAARGSALKALAQLSQLQRASLRLKVWRAFETEQQFQLEQHFAAQFGTALDPQHVRGRRGFIAKRA